MTDAQAARIQRMRDAGGRVVCIEDRDDGSIEVETGKGWLVFAPSGALLSRLERSDVERINARPVAAA
jgi:hypothetical protein